MISTIIFYFQCKLIHVKVISCAFQIMAGSLPGGTGQLTLSGVFVISINFTSFL